MKKSILLCALAATAFAAGGQTTTQAPMRAVYDRPAADWESEALPIGNGYMGAMIFGGVFNDQIQVNEKTLWSGGPSEDADYDGGHRWTKSVTHAALQEFRTELQKRMSAFDNSTYERTHNVNDAKTYNNDGFYDNSWKNDYVLNRMLGTKEHFGSFQTLGDIMIEDTGFPVIDQSTIKTNYDNSKNASETVKALFDGSHTTKWFSEDFNGTSFPVNIEWAYTNAPTVTGYTLVSGNDMPVRDPKRWVLYGSEDGSRYRKIDEQNGVFWTDDERRVAKDFTLASPAAGYKYFRLSIYSLVGAGQKPQLSEIELKFDDSNFKYDNYQRMLDIDNALQTVDYKYKGQDFHREYFMSYPDRVLVVKLTSDKPFSRKISMTTPHSDYSLAAATEGDVTAITLTGWPTPVSSNRNRENDNWRNCLRFASVLALHSTDGNVAVDGDAIAVSDAKEIVLVMSAATNYQPCYDNSFNYFSAENPLDKVNGFISTARGKDYDSLLESHKADYRNLYARNAIALGDNLTLPSAPTDSLLADYSAGTASPEVDRYLETLYYQFGRYLLIASSREGSLPANLQGVWGKSLANAWNADYHTNINIQMNYWPAEQTNLSECHLPMVDFVRSLEPRGTITAQHYHCRPDGGDVRGWTAYHEVNAWGNTAPAQEGTHSMFPEGGAWMCQDIWEHYLFTQDLDFLRKYFPVMKNAALFWVDNLWTDARDNTLVANPSMSPEHGAFSLGCTASQGIIYELFDAVGKAAALLGEADNAEVKEIAVAMSKLSMPKIGIGGQFMEWKDEVRNDLTGDGRWDPAQGRYVDTHRHTNHLYWLHPGSQIVPGRSDKENAYVDAMKVTLNTRGDEGTGWSRAWKLNFWARLRDGEHAHTMLRSCMNLTKPNTSVGGVYTNLFDAHPPFQIDGNFGFTSGVAEMLIQSQGGKIELIPSIPAVWSKGSFKGMKARGGFEVDAAWNKGEVTAVRIKSLAGKECVVKFKNAKDATVGGATKRIISDDEISFDTVKDGVVTLTMPGYDSISSIEADNSEADAKGPYYNLAGQRVSNPSHGIYVSRNGKQAIR